MSWRRHLLVVAVALGIVLVGTGNALAVPPDWRKVPHPEVEATLNDIAITNGGDTWVVGERRPPQDTGHPLAEHWDGTSWRAVPVPATPTGSGTLEGVSAVARDDVWAVGDSSGMGPVIRHWDGRAWRVVAPAPPPGNEHPGADRLYDINAVARDHAWAVGLFSDWDNPGPRTLIERWDGRTWTRVPSPNPGETTNVLQSVSAVSRKDAWAVGWSMSQQSVAIAMRWNGRTWKAVPVDPPPGNTQFYAVKALSARDVWAVGARAGRPLVMRWNGSRWRALPEPPIAETSLRAIAPDPDGGMWVAGSRITDDGLVRRPLFLHWNGRRWATGTSEEPEGGVQAMAPVGRSVWAVGSTSPCACFTAPPLVQVNGPVPGAR